MTLSGTNTYTGATTVSAGTLYLNGGAISTSSDIQVANGATYQVLVSSATSVSLYSRLATTDPSANKLNLVGSIINQNVSYTLGGSNVTMQWQARTDTKVSLGLASDIMSLAKPRLTSVLVRARHCIVTLLPPRVSSRSG